MSKKKAKQSGKKESSLEKILLITALANLISAIANLIKSLTG